MELEIKFQIKPGACKYSQMKHLQRTKKFPSQVASDLHIGPSLLSQATMSSLAGLQNLQPVLVELCDSELGEGIRKTSIPCDCTALLTLSKQSFCEHGLCAEA